MKPSPMFLSIPFSSCLPTCVCVWVHMCLLEHCLEHSRVILTLLPETLSLNRDLSVTLDHLYKDEKGTSLFHLHMLTLAFKACMWQLILSPRPHV